MQYVVWKQIQRVTLVVHYCPTFEIIRIVRHPQPNLRVGVGRRGLQSYGNGIKLKGILAGPLSIDNIFPVPTSE